MNKIFALYINEMIKISKKLSILIMLIIMVVGTIGLAGVMKLQQTMMDSGRSQQEMRLEWMLEEMEFQKQQLVDELASIERRLSEVGDTGDEMIRLQLEEERARMADQVELYEIALAEEIMLFNSESYLSQTLYLLTEQKAELRGLENIPEGERDEQTWQQAFEQTEAKLRNYEQVVKDKDFTVFLEIQADIIQADERLDSSAREIALERLDLWYQLDPSGGTELNIESYQVNNLLSRYENLKRSLNDQIDYTNYSGLSMLTPDRYNQMENELAVLLYQIEHDLVDLQSGRLISSTALDSMFGFGSFMLVLMMLILAGGAISQEIATGSIKSLIISPARRWKIFTAKACSLITVSLIGLAVLYMVTMFGHGVFFGFSTGLPYIHAIQGQAMALSFPAFHLAGMLVRLIDILVFMSLALMLSVLTRNTAAAVGISMAAFFGSSMVQPFLTFLPQAEWVKFLPFTHIGLMDQFFPFRDQVGAFSYRAMGIVEQSQSSLVFSLIYLAVLCFCLIYAALDSFNRRDIK